MNKKLILTSFVALGFACPAMAEPTNTSSTFPDASQNQYMQEDTTYTGAATSTNMAGVYQNNATVYANAKYHNVTYALAAGKYLPANSETPIDCDQNGYFCAGDDNGVNYSSSAQGLTQCPTGYGNSGTGAAANTDCYRTCTNNDVAHSTGTVNGGYYYGDNNQCEPTDCVNGWHVKSGTPDLMTLISTSEQIGAGFKANNPNAPAFNTSTYTLTQNGEFVVDYGNNGMVHGYGICSTQNGSKGTMSNGTYPDITTFDSLTDEWQQEGARYCYCNLDSYTPNGGSAIASSGVWVFINESSSSFDCATYCANTCENIFYYPNTDNADTLALRAALVGSIEPSPSTCEANTINISWDGATSTAVNANNAGTVTYGGNIRTPQSAIHVPGKVFDGWEFSTTAPQNPVTE